MYTQLSDDHLKKWIHTFKLQAQKHNFPQYHEFLSNLKLYIIFDRGTATLLGLLPVDYYSEKYDWNDYRSLLLNSIDRVSKSVSPKIYDLVIEPDLEKLHIYQSEIVSVETPWEKVNQGQMALINTLKASNHTLEFMSIGNTSRSLLKILSDEVFDPIRHTVLKGRDGKDLVIKGDKYKNKLIAFVSSVLASTEGNEDLKNLALATIDHIHFAVESSNTLAHKFGAEKHFAEVTAIGTINTISIIKLIKEIESKTTIH